jgi:hypothetical protein
MKDFGISLPAGVELGEWGSKDDGETENFDNGESMTPESPRDASDGISEEYLAMLTAIVDNYKKAGVAGVLH